MAACREYVRRAAYYGVEYLSSLERFVRVAGDQDFDYKSVILRESPAASQPLSKRSLSMFLQDATNACAPVRSTFMNDSSIFLNNSEIHVICRSMPGLFGGTFVAHYEQCSHRLGLRTVLDPSRAFFDGEGGVFPEGSFLVGLSMAFNQQRHLIPSVVDKYDFPVMFTHRYREQHLEIGQAVASMVYAAAVQGWEVRFLGPQLGFEALKRLMGLQHSKDLANEMPVAALLVFPSSAMSGGAEISASRIRTRILECFDDSLIWTGFPDISDRLGQQDMMCLPNAGWQATETIQGDEVVRIILDGNAVRPGLSSPDFHYPTDVRSMRQVLLTRNVEQRDFTGDCEISALQFRQFLLRCCWSADGDCSAPACFPHSALPWMPRVHVFFLIKRVQGFAPGTYCLVRNKLHPASVVEATTPADDQVPSFFRICSHTLDARNMAFGVAMVGTSHDMGESNVPRLLWEAGFVGESLMIEAHAQGFYASQIYCLDFTQCELDVGVHEDRELVALSYYTVGKLDQE